MNACGEIIKLSDMARVLSEVSRKKVNTPHLTEDEFYDEELPKKITPELWHTGVILHKKYVRIPHSCGNASVLKGGNGSLTVMIG